MFSRQQNNDISSPSSDEESDEYSTARAESVDAEYVGVSGNIGYSEAMSPGTAGLIDDLLEPKSPLFSKEEPNKSHF